MLTRFAATYCWWFRNPPNHLGCFWNPYKQWDFNYQPPSTGESTQDFWLPSIDLTCLRHLQAKVEYLEHENAQKDWTKKSLKRWNLPKFEGWFDDAWVNPWYGQNIQFFWSIQKCSCWTGPFFSMKYVWEARNKLRWELFAESWFMMFMETILTVKVTYLLST